MELVPGRGESISGALPPLQQSHRNPGVYSPSTIWDSKQVCGLGT